MVRVHVAAYGRLSPSNGGCSSNRAPWCDVQEPVDEGSGGSGAARLPPGVGLSVTNSLSVADMPRVCEGVARVLEAKGKWSRDPVPPLVGKSTCHVSDAHCRREQSLYVCGHRECWFLLSVQAR